MNKEDKKPDQQKGLPEWWLTNSGNLIHGVNCRKVMHSLPRGYLHAEDDDKPFDVDGVKYCGRCHYYLP